MSTFPRAPCLACRPLVRRLEEKVSRLDIRIALLEGMLKRSRLAEHDARVLAHAYEHDSKPPADVVTRSLARAAGREP